MKVDLNKLDTLKEKVMTAKDFKEPINYFFDHFGENPDFIQAGKRANNPLLHNILIKVGEALFPGQNITVTNIMLLEVKSHQFFHGSCFIHGRITNVFFFKDIDMGMCAIVMGGSNMMMSRFSSTYIEGNGGGARKVFVAPGSQSIN